MRKVEKIYKMVFIFLGEIQHAEKEGKKGKGKNAGYTRAMSLVEEMEEEKGDKEFSDSVNDSEEDIDDEFDAYLQVRKKKNYEWKINFRLGRRRGV